MEQHFFTGGQICNDDLLVYFQNDVKIRNQRVLNGQDYQKTAQSWLANMDQHRDELLKLFSGVYGKDDALKWFVRWRIFFMACAEVWGYHGGAEWVVSHYLLERAQASA